MARTVAGADRRDLALIAERAAAAAAARHPCGRRIVGQGADAGVRSRHQPDARARPESSPQQHVARADLHDERQVGALPEGLDAARLLRQDLEAGQVRRRETGSRVRSVSTPTSRPTDTRTTISIKNLRSSLVPAPYPALGISGLKGPWQFERMGLTIRSARGDTRGQTYTVNSLKIAPTADQMRELSTRFRPSLEPFLALPRQDAGRHRRDGTRDHRGRRDRLRQGAGAAAVPAQRQLPLLRDRTGRRRLRRQRCRRDRRVPRQEVRATASTSPRRWRSWRARSAYRRASPSATRRATSSTPAAARTSTATPPTTCTPGPSSTSRAQAGSASSRHRASASATAFAEADGAPSAADGQRERPDAAPGWARRPGVRRRQRGTDRRRADSTTTRTLVATGRRAAAARPRARGCSDAYDAPGGCEASSPIRCGASSRTPRRTSASSRRAPTPREASPSRLRGRNGVDVEALDRLLRQVEAARFSRDGAHDDDSRATCVPSFGHSARARRAANGCALRRCRDRSQVGEPTRWLRPEVLA